MKSKPAVLFRVGAVATLAVVLDCDHFFNGVEAEFARLVCDRLTKTTV